MSDDPSKTVQIPAVVWQLVKWVAGICGTGAMGILVILVSHVIGINGRLSAVEREGETLKKIDARTEYMSSSIEEVKRDVAVLKARQP